MASPIPPRRTLVDEVYDAVAALLLDGDIAPGAKVNIESVARDLDVSPTPVREALARLESEGLVVKRALRGYTSASLLDADGFDDLFQLRFLLEPEAARLAAENLVDETLRGLRGLLDEMTALSESASPGTARFADYRAFAARDAEVHRVIAEGSGNRLLADAIVRLRPHLHHYRLHFQRGDAVETNAEHSAIIAALEKRDPAAAEAAMRRHLEFSRARTLDYLLTGSI
ncbi:GntR family transcriptional regulator [Microbacterium sp. 179-I 3D3 NHS]|uniref:GntR family transcriptional regulator n=1 Tax=unclassified Microbacterium TaxID=2609290 RepID=UPI0039A37BD2